ncbi:hypothetical protein BZG36_03048 [Bifiguratus adelaidae]|uniref:Choline/carnitine acyltransferase domain-containing protein n=1 Tax=Bifiguratus adelaidae TaxID=1938954 RepID=A0A261XZ13_9FUNG|nr:hypothetical protein BZG36_03048 [Bifiguratus adelaidae]
MPLSNNTSLSPVSDDPEGGLTFKYQDSLPRLPIPPLADTIQRYLAAVAPFQDADEHAETEAAAIEFLANEGPELQEKLTEYADTKSSYIEEFWYDSYLSYTDPVVLNLNPFFLLEDDPTPQRNDQVVRAASLIVSTLKFVSALRDKAMEPDVIKGIPLDMSQFTRLFGTSRLPTHNGCMMSTSDNSRHIVVLVHSQFYHFEVFDENGKPCLSNRDIVQNLRAIKEDAAKTPINEIAKGAVGVLTTENRKIWAGLRKVLNSTDENRDALSVVDSALFIVCLDHVAPKSTTELATNMLCGTYNIQAGVQIGTCTNRWYDKLQIIVCENGSAGINFEHTGVDGHTVLRFVSDIYTDTILRFAQTINSQTKSLFHSKGSNDADNRHKSSVSVSDPNPLKIEWNLNNELRLGIRFAETRLSDLILQNELEILEFEEYGKNFITSMKFSPDAFVQMAFQAAYYGLYGKVESTYEPAMTKAFLHGRTEAIRTVTSEVVDFVKTFCSDQPMDKKISTLRKAAAKHTKLTQLASKGLGVDRHLYALECLWHRLHSRDGAKKPAIFTDGGYATLNASILSTSNCGNPALRMFGFGPVVSSGFGIGYIIKDEGIALCVSSKHRQTERFIRTIHDYLLEIQSLLLREKYPAGVSSRQYRATMEQEVSMMAGYGYFDAGDLDQWSDKNEEKGKKVGKKVGKPVTMNEMR